MKIKNKIKLTVKIFRALLNRPLRNIYNTNYTKKVLISYITRPFKINSLSHSNFYEAQSAAKVFHELGYCVDVIDYDSKPPSLKNYDVIYGFGDVFRDFFESSYSLKKTIYYATGMHVSHQNNASLLRVKDVYLKKGRWLGKSARFVEKTWTHQTCLVDGIVALGNEICQQSYEKYYNGKIYSVTAPFYQILDPLEIIKNRKSGSKKNFLWFGSSGLIHKGLDLCLEYFQTRPDLNLHVCGNIYSEPEFVEAYNIELFKTSNIHCHGFVDIGSEKFKSILECCAFTIFPSCSEGGCVSVLTTIGNGALIPIITKETTINTGHVIWIDSLDLEGLDSAIARASLLSDDDLVLWQKKNFEYVISHNSQENYFNNLKKSIIELLKP